MRHTWKRAGLRRRSKAKKARMRDHLIRTHTARWIGEEHRRMRMFRALGEYAKVSPNSYCVDGPARGLCERPLGERTFEVAMMRPFPDTYTPDWVPPPVEVHTYRQIERRIGMAFFGGSKQVVIKLPRAYTVGDPADYRAKGFLPCDPAAEIEMCRPQEAYRR